jgi:ATP/maltotriose-dependent transcriptional regulator MalT/DNA-binding SARP family transcriptional activator
MLARERLFARLDELRERPVVWVAAEPGAGKTTLLASYLEARRIPGIWYHVDPGDADPASFFYHLGVAAQGLKRGKSPVPPLPLLTPDQGTDLAGFSRRFFRALYQRMGRNSALVLDNLHELPEAQPIHRALAAAFEETPEGVNSLVASRVEPPGAYTPLITRDRFAFVEASDIRLTLDEAGEIVHHRADLDARTVRKLHEQCGGWAAGLTLLVERARRGEPVADGNAQGVLQPVFAYFADQLIAQDFHDDVETLMALAFVQRATAETARALSGDANAGALLEKLHRRHLFTQRRVLGGEPSYELHALLRAYLQQRATQAWSGERRREVMARAAALLERNGEAAEAVRIYRELQDWPALARVAVTSAQALMTQGRRLTIREWIGMLPEAVRESQPRVLYWLGSAMAPDAPREARVHLVRAHAAFVAAGEPVGRVLATAGIVYTYYLDVADLRELDPWIAELNAVVDSGARMPTAAIELHLRAALLFALCFRQPDPARIRDNAARMFVLLEDASIAANEKVAAAALLLFHCYHHADLEAGQRLVRLMEPLLEACAPGVQGLWWIQVGFMRMTSGDTPRAIEAFERSAAIGAENSLRIPLLEVYVQMGLGMCAVLAGDLERADRYRQRAEGYWKTFRQVDVAANAMLRGVIAAHRGELDSAREFAREHFEVSDQAGIQWQAHNALLHCACVAYASGRREEGLAATARSRALVKGTVFERFSYQAELLDGYGALLAGDREALERHLTRGLATGRVDLAKFFLRLQPQVLPRLFAAALEADIESDVVRRDIRNLGIAPPDPFVESWPWPLAVRTLGRFEVRRDGKPLEFSRKAPKKTLALLKAIVALGGSNVREQALLDALWPDEEGDAAAKSLGASVLRLRTLLGDSEAVIQQGGTLSLDRGRIWVDAWAFERAGQLEFYHGAFLAEDEGERWAIPMRERLRSRFVHQVADHGRALEGEGRHEEAIGWYRRGLDADNIVETFYQGLMRCHHRLGRRAEAIAAYRSLRQILSVTLGLPPSAASEKLRREIESEVAL